MRNTFLGYYPPSSEEMEELWEEGLIILDTNALLHLFRYSSRAREDFLRVLEAKRDALWIPYQVGSEFHRNRVKVIHAQRGAFKEIRKSLDKASEQILNALRLYKRHPSLNTDKLSQNFETAVQALRDDLEAQSNEHSEKMVDKDGNGQILEIITRLYENKVGKKYEDVDLEDIYEQGQDRYAKKVPPGYEDDHKEAPEKYGDWILWKQILDHASEVKKPAIFVTDDRKEDWWYMVNDHRQGPRPELIHEYATSSGKRIHLMTSDRFLEFAKTKIGNIQTSSVDEAEILSEYYATTQESVPDRELESIQTDHYGSEYTGLDANNNDLFILQEEISNWEARYSEQSLEQKHLHRLAEQTEQDLVYLLEQQNEDGISSELRREIPREIRRLKRHSGHLKQELREVTRDLNRTSVTLRELRRKYKEIERQHRQYLNRERRQRYTEREQRRQRFPDSTLGPTE